LLIRPAGVELNEPLSKEYLAQAEATLKSQVSYGASRLSALLQSIYRFEALQ
jgi:hypothetical protein